MIKFILQHSGALSTLFAGLIAVILFYWERYKKKTDAARIVLQEIRRAEDIINSYKENEKYHFTKKIIATNSWAKNIHFFVSNLDQDELDKISTLYSTGEYLDLIINKISNKKFNDSIKQSEQGQQELNLPIKKTDNENKFIMDKNIKHILLPMQMEAPWKLLLDTVTYKHEPIYHSNIGRKLKKIARLK